VTAALAPVLAVALLALGACGDDDDDQTAPTSAETESTTGGDELCAALDDLEQDIDTLADIDVVAEGTDAVRASVTAIGDDLSEIREVAPDAAPEEAEEFESALASLDDAVAALGDGSLTAESARDVIIAVTSTVQTGQRYVGALDDACEP
jgi:hypothetical protein